MNGEGKLYYENSVFEGTYVCDNKHGKGVCTFDNGKKVEGIWINGK